MATRIEDYWAKEEAAEKEAMARTLRFEAHQKRFGDTAKMRARMGLKEGEVPEGAWNGDYCSGGSMVPSGGHVERKPLTPSQRKRPKK